MYPIPPHEHLVETRTCKHCQTPFPITDKDMEFYAKISPKFGEKTYMIPPPTLCPDCRQQRRLSFRNERKLYKRKCDATGKDIISIYSPDKPYKVYNQDYWWSDAWDPMDYGRDFDFSEGFFEQFKRLYGNVPKIGLLQDNSSENCEYVNFGSRNKNSYLIIGIGCENVLYSTNIYNSSFCSDCHFVYSSSYLYECINAFNCYNASYLKNCQDCSNSSLLEDCSNCEYCFGCKNLRNRKYYIFNTPYSQEEYEKVVSKSYYILRQDNKKVYEDFFQKTPSPCIISRLSEDVSGNYLYEGKHCYNCFETIGGALRCKDCVTIGLDCSDLLSCSNVSGHLCYEGDGLVHVQKASLSHFIRSSNNISYSLFCYESSDLFACVGLRNKQYCILNKQYTKEEYEVLVPRIIEHMMKTGEWGEFFPSSMSPFGYNETVAQEYYPLSRDEILGDTPLGGGDARRAEGVVSEISEANPPVSLLTGGSSKDTFLHGPIFNYSDYEPPFPKVEKIIPANKLPDDISKIPDDILNWAIECEVTKKPFRIIPQELAFYRKHNIPIPRRHPDQRHLDRMAQRNPRKLYERLCDCPNCEENAKKSGSYREEEFDLRDPETRSGGQRRKMITTYAPERPETVYCEVCYEREI